jgi:hypothetical protein
VVNGVPVATLNPDEHYFFGSNVTTFSLEGIMPPVDTADPSAFPTFLDFTGTATNLTMTALSSAVPEPSTWLLLATGLVGALGYGWRQKRRMA